MVAIEAYVAERQAGAAFPDYLVNVMATRGITASRIAEYAGVGRTTVNYWLRGVTVPKPESLRKLARGLNTPYPVLRDLVEGIEESTTLSAMDAAFEQAVARAEALVEEALRVLREARQHRPPRP